jgi:hypothetical protein
VGAAAEITGGGSWGAENPGAPFDALPPRRPRETTMTRGITAKDMSTATTPQRFRAGEATGFFVIVAAAPKVSEFSAKGVDTTGCPGALDGVPAADEADEESASNGRLLLESSACVSRPKTRERSSAALSARVMALLRASARPASCCVQYAATSALVVAIPPSSIAASIARRNSSAVA